MGQSKSCFVKQQTVCNKSSSSLHSSLTSADRTLSSHVHSTTPVKLLSPAIVTDLRGRDIPIDSESSCSRSSCQCTESKNLYPIADLTNLKFPTNAIDDPHARIKYLEGVNEHRLVQDINSTVNASHTKIHLIDKNDESICKNENECYNPLPSNISDTEVVPSATTPIPDIVKDTNAIDSDVPGDTIVTNHSKCNTNKTEDTNNNTNNDPINDGIVVRKGATRKSLKRYLKYKLGPRSLKLEEEGNLLANDRKMMIIQPHPIVLNLDPNNKMDFFYEKRGKLSRLTNGKGKRKKNGYFSKPPKNRAAELMGTILPKVRKTKIKLVVRNQARVKKCMQEMVTTRKKLDCDVDSKVVCGKQIYATRYYAKNDHPNITAVENAETIDVNPALQNLTQDGAIINYSLKETSIEGAREQIAECKNVANNSITTCKSQPCIRVSGGDKPELNNACGKLRIHRTNAKACGAMNSKSPTAHSDRTIQQVDDYSQWFLNNYSTFTKQIIAGSHDTECETGKRVTSVAIPRGIAHYLYVDYSILNTRVEPVNKVAHIDQENKIYVCDIGLTSSQCDFIVKITEYCSSGAYAAYTYAKQTLGCREHDELAAVCEWPVMRACSTIQKYLESVSSEEDGCEGIVHRNLVLDEREPHVVKYDLSRVEHQKLDMHTDKSEWTFLISLSDDYEGGGTYFESIDSTIHLQKGHALFFPGKLRHRGQKIISGTRYLLVGFLVEKRFDIPYLFD